MTPKLDDAFRLHATALGLRAQRQQVLASNIANADTPNYKARDTNFAALLDAAAAGRGAPGTLPLAATSTRHLPPAASAGGAAAGLLYRVPVQASVDGNTVEMDVERAQFAENAMRYEASVTLLGMEIKKLLAAIQG